MKTPSRKLQHVKKRIPPPSGKTENSEIHAKASGKMDYLLVMILFIAVVVYLRVFQNGLTGRDDDWYILHNPFITSLDFQHITAMFSNYYMGNYHPLSMLAMAVGYQLGGTDAWPYQLMNLLFHLANILLVFRFISLLLAGLKYDSRKVRWIALFVAFLFGLHPVQVESVAWISEIKNVLYTFFFLLSLIAYIRYLKSARLNHYLLAVVFFILSLFSKGMAVSLSVTLIAIDYLMTRNLMARKVMLEKIPFLILSVGFGILAIFAQGTSVSHTTGGGEYNLIKAVSFACYGFTHYIINLVLPFSLSPVYEYLFDTSGALPYRFYIYPLVVIPCMLILFFRIRNYRIYLFAVLFLIINLFLVLQLLPVGDAIMADRYVYIPSVGFFLFIALGLYGQVQKMQKWKFQFYSGMAIYGSILLVTTYNRIGVWKNNMTLWTDVLEKSGNNAYSRAWVVRSRILSDEKKYTLALAEIDKYILKNPHDAAYFQRAFVKTCLNDHDGAIEDYTEASRLDSSNALIYNNLGNLRNKLGRYSEAINDFNKAIALNDTFLLAYKGRADTKILLKNYTGALADLNTSLDIRPDDADVLNNRGTVKITLGDLTGAIHDFDRAIILRENFLEAYQNRILARLKLPDYKGAIADLDIVIMIEPLPMAYYLRGFSKYKLNMHAEACNDISQSLSMGYRGGDPGILKECGFEIQSRYP